MKYDLKDIITFTHVAKLRSFIKTAKILNVSKAVVSNRINALENSLKLTLFLRTTREVNLTDDGRIFFDYCSSLAENVKILDEFLQDHQKISGQLKLVLPSYFSRYYIVPHLEEFFQKYPSLKLDISLTENPINIISEAIWYLQVRNQIPEEEDLEIAKLMTNHKIVCASPKYLAKYGKPKNPKDLLNHNCLIFGENNIWQFKHKSTKELIKICDMNGNVKCDNGEIIKELVMAGIGITLKSIKDVEEEIKSEKLITLFPDYEIINQTQFYAVYPARKYMSPRIRAFIEFFREKLYLLGM